MMTAVVIGNLGSDPEMKYSANGSPFLRFNIASNYRVRGEDGAWSDAVEWVRGTIFGNRAESLAQHLKKGMRVVAQGRLEARPWVDSNDNTRAGLELTISEIDFQSAPNGQGGQQAAARPQQGQQGRQQQQGGRGAPSGRHMPENVAVHGGRGPQQRGMDDGGDLDDLPF